MKIIKILLGLIILIFISFNVNAFGVATPFAANEDVYVPAGESKEFVFSIQNGAAAIEDVNAKVEILEGSNIAEIINKQYIYLIPAGGEKSFNLKINIPENAKEDDKFSVKLSVKAITPNEAGAINMGYGVITGFNVITIPPVKPEIPTGSVVKEKGEVNYNNFLTALVVVVIAGIIIFLMRRKESRIKKKK